MSASPTYEDGFSLVETLVAFVVVATAAVGVLSGVRTAIRATAEERFFALQTAEALFWSARTGDPAELETEGVYGEEGLVWSRTITPLAISDDVLEVRVEVPWRVGQEIKSVSLVGYRQGFDDEED